MLYKRIALCLDEISGLEREKKAKRIAKILSSADKQLLVPLVRLISGELQPPWNLAEIRVGPHLILDALDEISLSRIPDNGYNADDVGSIVEAALSAKSQNPLSSESLSVECVWERLQHLYHLSGPDSEHRKKAILVGLFLDATPVEGKCICRTILGNMHSGFGKKLLISSLCKAFCCEEDSAQKAYNVFPDIGEIAIACREKTLQNIRISPPTPVRQMVFRTGMAPSPQVFLARWPGIRLEVHRADGELFYFTSSQKNISSALRSISFSIDDKWGDFIIDAELIGFQEGILSGQKDMLGYINRRRRSIRRDICPALLIFDLIYLRGEDVTGRTYEERRNLLESAFGAPKNMPFSGISLAKELIFSDKAEIKSHLDSIQKFGGKGLLVRNTYATYVPGATSERDFLINDSKAI